MSLTPPPSLALVPEKGLEAPAETPGGLAALSGRAGTRFRRLGTAHAAALAGEGPVLIVGFETDAALGPDNTRQPLAWQMAGRHDWAGLALISRGDTWFRDPAVYAYFDDLSERGFFDRFERVLFYGTGPCAYAACAFSVAAPGAQVLALQPQATLDPDRAEWDDRFAERRRLSFTDRYGYAPDMLDAAHGAFVLYDPAQPLDAMHAALFARPNVTRMRLRRLGGALQGSLSDMGLLPGLVRDVATDRADPAQWARQLRTARRDHLPYLRHLLGALDVAGHDDLARRLCAHVAMRHDVPPFRDRVGAKGQGS